MGDELGLDRVERELTVLARRLERVRMQAGAGEPGLIVDRSAYLLLGRLLDEGPTRLSALAAVFGLDMSTVSRQVTALSTAGLVERAPDPTDGRASLLRLTDLGSARTVATRAYRRQVFRELLAGWSTEDEETFGRLLERYNAACAARYDGEQPAAVPAGAMEGRA